MIAGTKDKKSGTAHKRFNSPNYLITLKEKRMVVMNKTVKPVKKI